MYVSAGCLEALAWVDLPKSFLRFTVPNPAWHLGSCQAGRKVMVSKRDSELTGGKAKPVSLSSNSQHIIKTFLKHCSFKPLDLLCQIDKREA